MVQHALTKWISIPESWLQKSPIACAIGAIGCVENVGRSLYIII